MISTDQRTAPAVPAPRTGSPDDRPGPGTSDLERRRTTPRARPRTEYWDVAGARWVSAPRD